MSAFLAHAPTPARRVARAARRGAFRLLRDTALLEHLQSALQRPASYSQFGEDVHLRSYYERLAHERGIAVEDGCVVDIGAFRPICYSNSYLFHRRGWHGINIDPTPGFRRSFDQVRPRDTNLEIGIAPDAGTATFHLFGTPSLWNTLDADSAAHAAAVTGITPRAVEVGLSRLDAVLDRHLGARSLELLLIDAEGYDVEILRSGDFTRFRPRVILIEVMDASLETLADSPVVQFLRPFGYQLHSWLNPSLMLVREDSMLRG